MWCGDGAAAGTHKSEEPDQVQRYQLCLNFTHIQWYNILSKTTIRRVSQQMLTHTSVEVNHNRLRRVTKINRSIVQHLHVVLQLLETKACVQSLPTSRIPTHTHTDTLVHAFTHKTYQHSPCIPRLAHDRIATYLDDWVRTTVFVIRPAIRPKRPGKVSCFLGMFQTILYIERDAHQLTRRSSGQDCENLHFCK